MRLVLAALLLLLLLLAVGCSVAPLVNPDGSYTGDYVVGFSAGDTANFANKAGDTLSLLGIPYAKPIGVALGLLFGGHGIYSRGKDKGWNENDAYNGVPPAAARQAAVAPPVAPPVPDKVLVVPSGVATAA